MPQYEPPTHREYMQAVQAANDAIVENGFLRRRNDELEQRLEAVELTPARIGDLGSADLTQLAVHYRALLDEIVGELRARHHDVAEELIEARIRALESELAAAKERAWEAHQRAHDLEQENARLMAALDKLADVQQEPEQEHEQALEPESTR